MLKIFLFLNIFGVCLYFSSIYLGRKLGPGGLIVTFPMIVSFILILVGSSMAGLNLIIKISKCNEPSYIPLSNKMLSVASFITGIFLRVCIQSCFIESFLHFIRQCDRGRFLFFVVERENCWPDRRGWKLGIINISLSRGDAFGVVRVG
jgi:hypothetical protein